MLSNGVTSIGNSAFYYCTALTSVTIPDSVTSIESTAFGDCSDDLCLLGSANSYAERYARENRFVFVCLSQDFSVALTDTTVRSLHSAAIFCRITGSGPVTVRYESANPFVALVDEQGVAQGLAMQIMEQSGKSWRSQFTTHSVKSFVRQHVKIE